MNIGNSQLFISHLLISRPPPPRPKGVAPGHGHPLIKRGVNNNESDIRAQMEDVESEMNKLEIQGAKLEDMLRFKTNTGDFKSVNTLIYLPIYLFIILIK